MGWQMQVADGPITKFQAIPEENIGTEIIWMYKNYLAKSVQTVNMLSLGAKTTVKALLTDHLLTRPFWNTVVIKTNTIFFYLICTLAVKNVEVTYSITETVVSSQCFNADTCQNTSSLNAPSDVASTTDGAGRSSRYWQCDKRINLYGHEYIVEICQI